MSRTITFEAPAERSLLNSVAAWLRQMKSAIARPVPTETARHIEIAKMVDRGVTRIRLNSQDPRL